jgi:dephospho-CoA kinase
MTQATVLALASEMRGGKGVAAGLYREWKPAARQRTYSDTLHDLYMALLRDFRLCGEGTFPVQANAKEIAMIEVILERVFWPSIKERFIYRRLEKFVAWMSGDFAVGREVWDKIPRRSDIQRLSENTRKFFGDDILELAMVAWIERAMEEGVNDIVIDGPRRLEDIAHIRVGDRWKFRLVYIDVKPEIAWRRFRAANKNTGDADASLEEFTRLMAAEPERRIRLLRKGADKRLVNNGTKEQFARKFRRYLREEGLI